MAKSDIDIHDHKKVPRRTLESVRENEDISLDNRMKILDFYQNCRAEGLGIPRIIHYLRLHKPFEDVDRNDVVMVLSADKTKGKIKCFQ